MGKIIKLCCGGKGCATVEKTENNIIITDDKGNKVTLTEEAAALLGWSSLSSTDRYSTTTISF